MKMISNGRPVFAGAAELPMELFQVLGLVEDRDDDGDGPLGCFHPGQYITKENPATEGKEL